MLLLLLLLLLQRAAAAAVGKRCCCVRRMMTPRVQCLGSFEFMSTKFWLYVMKLYVFFFPPAVKNVSSNPFVFPTFHELGGTPS